MHYTSHEVVTPTAISELQRMVEFRQKPDHEDYKKQQKLAFLNLRSDSHTEPLERLISDWSETTKPKQVSHQGNNLWHWQQIVYNLARATAFNRWLGVNGDSNQYISMGGFAYRNTDRVLQELQSRGWLEKQQGKRFKDKPRVNHYYPSDELRRILAPFALLVESANSFNRSFLSINAPDKPYENFEWRSDHPDAYNLALINEFAQGHSWAQKGAIQQTFKHTPFQSGRLTTPFQNLPDRHFKVRINTLINGNPITEVDCNANHLRLFLAVNGRSIKGEDAYEPIAEKAGVDRQSVKAFINVALNCSDYETAKYTTGIKFSVPHADSLEISYAFHKLYSDLNLFGKFSLVAMQLEGQILKQVMLKGVRDGVLALPIHDAVAVESQNADWAEATLKECWETVVRDFQPNATVKLKRTTAQ